MLCFSPPQCRFDRGPDKKEKGGSNLNTSVFVGKLDKAMGDDELAALFAHIGGICSATVKRHGDNKSKKWGYSTVLLYADTDDVTHSGCIYHSGCMYCPTFVESLTMLDWWHALSHVITHLPTYLPTYPPAWCCFFFFTAALICLCVFHMQTSTQSTA